MDYFEPGGFYPKVIRNLTPGDNVSIPWWNKIKPYTFRRAGSLVFSEKS